MSSSARRQPSSSARRQPAGGDQDGFEAVLMDPGNKQLVQYTLMFVGFLALLKIVVTSLMSVYIIVFPLCYVYLLQTCPSVESFEGKKELKRVLRGKHLPDTHPDKPKGYFEKMAAKVSASLATELATLPGYKQEMTSFGGAALLATMRVPSAKLECYWGGALGGWYYLYSRELKPAKQD
jgi:hypothetical protein